MATFRDQAQALKNTIGLTLKDTGGLRTITGPAHRDVDFAEVDSIFSNLLAMDGDNARIVRTTGGTNADNAASLLAAYNAAKALTPNGNAISATNRVVLLLQPGTYDFETTPFNLNGAFIDLVGIGAREDVVITGSVITNDSAVVLQSVNDVRLQNITIRNTANSLQTDTAAAYRPMSVYAASRYINVAFESITGAGWAMAASCDGYWQDCSLGDYAMSGYSNSGDPYTINGTFVNCVAGWGAWGGDPDLGVTQGANVTAKFYGCTGGSGSFGSLSSAHVFDCTVVETDGVSPITSTPAIIGGFNWKGPSEEAFSGHIKNCVCLNSVGGFMYIPQGTDSVSSTGIIEGCYAISGFLITPTVGPDCALVIKNCISPGAAFIAANVAGVTFYDCVGGTGSFFGDEEVGGSTNGTFINCSMFGGYLNTGSIPFVGKMDRCTLGFSGSSTLIIGAGARLYDTTVTGTAATAINAVSAITASIAACRLSGAIGGNVTNNIDTPNNVIDANLT